MDFNALYSKDISFHTFQAQALTNVPKKYSWRKFLLGSTAVIAAPGVAGLIIGNKGVETDDLRKDSLWTTEIPAIPNFPIFEGERKVDLVIIGGGYTGLSCAYYAKLLRPEWSVIVLEPHRIGSGASSRNSEAVRASNEGLTDSDMPQRGFDRLKQFIESEEISSTLGLHLPSFYRRHKKLINKHKQI